MRETYFQSASAELNVEDGSIGQGATVLELAVDTRTPGFVEALLAHGANPNTYVYGFPLIMGVGDDIGWVRRLLNYGANIDAPDHSSGETALTKAASKNHFKLVDFLIASGANLNGATGGSAIARAAFSGCTRMVEHLLTKGADPNFHRPGHWSALEYARERRDTKMIEILERAGARARPVAELRREWTDLRRKEQALEDRKWQSHVEKYQQYAKLVPEDSAVVSAVIDEVRRKNAVALDSKKRLRLLNRSVDIRHTFSRDGLTLDPHDKSQKVSLVMLVDLMRRNVKPVSLVNLHTDANKVVLVDYNTINNGLMVRSSPWQGSSGWMRIYMPGYSSDGNTAVLTFQVGPTDHGSDCTALVTKTRGTNWRVVWMNITYRL